MEITQKERDHITEFFLQNREKFEEKLLSEAVNVAGKISEILQKGNINLLKNAEKLVLYIVEQKEADLISFAQQEGKAWAKNALTLSFKLEWVQAIRRTVWHFLYQYDRLSSEATKREEFYAMEKKINDSVDQFLNTFFISYSNYKDEMLNSQRKLVEHLSVPIIPISTGVAVLPLIGTIDPYRMQTIEEKVLSDISSLSIQTLIMDMSGITSMDVDVIVHFEKILNGVSMMGCKAVITGLRAELVRKMIHLGVSFEKKAETKGTLQQTLKDYIHAL
ncbi:anti-anti-sigma regulatory factor [Peribacillus deserti]|uniref:Anti-anti-sigma regulatory factor n=1 Tax=Peribacillus deserti TaxID=673318 RepID=A0ABS2QJT7_9BACI|nr:STAS domain-containing protein [Peribacillus deserti]MBM7692768.1 anti-anti-sigma regulatory factor [Peribacillus deserti]